MTGARSRRSPAAGFTLLELLIATTLLALLTTLLFGGIRFGTMSWAKVEQRTSNSAEVAAVRDIFRRVISAARPSFASADLSDHTVVFEGARHSLTLIAPLPEVIGQGVAGRQRFFLAGSGPSRALTLNWRLDLPGSDDATAAAEQTARLLDRVRTISFSYFGRLDGGREWGWWSEWSGQSALPRLVRISIERDDPSLPPWPEMIAETQVSADPTCVYQTASADCIRK